MNIGEARAAILNGGPVADVIEIKPTVKHGGPVDLDSLDDPTPSIGKRSGTATLPNGGRWARYAGKLGAALTVTASGAIIRKGGREPREPDDADVDLLQEALEEGLKVRFGDGPVPWWLGAALAAGGVYAGMRVGAQKIPGSENPKELQSERPAETPQVLMPNAIGNKPTSFKFEPLGEVKRST